MFLHIQLCIRIHVDITVALCLLLHRILEFTVEDSHNTTSTPSYLMVCPLQLFQQVTIILYVFPLQLAIAPINDAPILSYQSDGSQEMYSYIEDDPVIKIGRNITLADIDSPIMSVSLSLTSEDIHDKYSDTCKRQDKDLKIKFQGSNFSKENCCLG